MPLSEQVTSALDELLARNPHVVGYSEDEQPDERSGRTGVRLYVVEERPLAELDVPEEIEGMPVVDLVAAGRPENHNTGAGVQVGVDPKTRVRPVIGGISISGSGSGTLGYFVERKDGRCLISSAHVLRPSKADVIQPSRLDGGKDPADKVARLAESVVDFDAGVDAAAAVLEVASTLDLNELGKVVGTATVSKGDAVRISAAESRVRRGKVHDPNVTITVQNDGTYKHQIAIVGEPPPFEVAGDSGALVVTDDLKAVGLNKCGGPHMSFANPIGAVLAALQATLST